MRPPRVTPAKGDNTLLALFAFLALFLASWIAAAEPQGARRDPMRYFFTPTLGDLKTEAAEAREAGKQAVFVMYVRDDCPYCERMKRDLLSRPDVQDYFRRHFAVLALDIRGAVPVVDFAGRSTTEKRFASAQDVKYSPVIVLYDFDGKPLARVNGEIRHVRELMLLGEFVASGAYRTDSFAGYKQSIGSKKGS